VVGLGLLAMSDTKWVAWGLGVIAAPCFKTPTGFQGGWVQLITDGVKSFSVALFLFPCFGCGDIACFGALVLN